MKGDRISLSHLAFKGEQLPAVICADRFYMTDQAISNLESSGKVIWADCKDEDELVEKVLRAKVKVIISEYFKITARVMDASQVLKGIVVWGVGYDHVDVDAASERGVYVVNTRGSNADSVAEHTFSLMLCLSRKILQANTFVRKGEWVSRQEAGLPYQLIAQDLCGKTIGIVGLGAVGSRVAGIARSFGMHVLAYDPYVSVETAKTTGAKLVDLEKLLRKSNFVTLHVSLTNETKGIISAGELDLMKPTAYIINTSRGPIVDEEALIRALSEKKIRGAGLDVFTSEPLDLETPLLKFDNVVVTPHCAGNSEEALKATSLKVSQEAARILQGKIPQNLVNELQLSKRGFLNRSKASASVLDQD